VTGERADASALGLREEGMIGEAVVLQQVRERAGATAKAERIDRQHRELVPHVIPTVARGLILPRERLSHDDPQGVARRRAMAGGEQELVTVGMLRAPVVEVQAAALATGEVGDDVEWRVRERAAKMTGLRVIAQQHQGHARHEPDVFQPVDVGQIGTL
jgi:hypothetical protein